MLIQERQKRILTLVNLQGNISIKELSSRLNVSEMTIWRDLQLLDSQKLIKRVRGGAIKEQTKQNNEPQFEYKEAIHSDEKIKIAQYAAAELIGDGEIIILEGGTTVASMVPFLEKKNLTLLTNGLNTINKASAILKTITVMCCGGILRDISHTFVGPQAEAFFSGFHANKIFLSATGFTFENGLTDPNPLEVQIKQAMVKSVEKVIALIDSSKFGRNSLSQIIMMEDIDILVTDSGAPENMVNQLKKIGVDVRVVN
jgi:DeoR/GlpR family transcriptional regulator of sugar metabolism